jgi:[acyl-carrier-protein] S-malonyltransferase
MRAAGVTRFVEVGPGRVLSGLIRRIAPEAETLALDDPNAPGGLADPDATAPA